MRPAFSSTKQAAAFALLLLVLLLLPVLAGKKFLPARDQIYSSTSLRYASSHFLRQQIFEESEDIDIAFIGSSRMAYGIDTPYVQKKLSEKLGRKAVVITLGWSWSGFDALYLITQDLLQHRKVHLLVVSEELLQENDPHRAAAHWFRWGDNFGSVVGLPFRLQAEYYFGAILGMPRNLLSLVRPNIPELVPAEADVWLDRTEDRKGAATIEFGYGTATNFSPYVPAIGISNTNNCIYSPATRNRFRFEHSAAPLQLHFARQFGQLVLTQQVRLAYLHIPVLSEVRSPILREKEFWPDLIGTNAIIFGIPPATMFSGLNNAEVFKLFFNPLHLNRNGQQYFTRLFTPTLLEIYDHQASP
jgi:hypothetical protein